MEHADNLEVVRIQLEEFKQAIVGSPAQRNDLTRVLVADDLAVAIKATGYAQKRMCLESI